jgi:hypothetical protein
LINIEKQQQTKVLNAQNGTRIEGIIYRYLHSIDIFGGGYIEDLENGAGS